MRDVDEHRLASWLQRWKLDRYAEVFVGRGIDLQTLSRLGNDELKKLGVLPRHRTILLGAIRQLGDAVGPERRQVTVLFCDMVGSTELSSGLDLDDLYDVMRQYQAVCAEVMNQHGGFVAKYLGDGLLVYFGYPATSEDAPDRAVRAGLEVLTAVNRIPVPGGRRLQVRVGAATGAVVVGDVVGTGGSREIGITGQVPNLAARILSVTEPGTFAIADSTRRLVGGRFHCDDLGPCALAGIHGMTRLWQVTREQPEAMRFEALRASGPGCLFGRDRETSVLADRWKRAQEGQGQIVVLSGEAGIGKSRLLSQFEQSLGGGLGEQPVMRVRVQCTERHVNSPLHPLIVHMRWAAGIEPDDSAQTQLDKIEQMLPPADRAQSVPLMAKLLSVPSDPAAPVLALPAARQKALTLKLVIEQTLSLSNEQALLLLVEDAHWIDPTSAELAEQLVELLRDRRVLAVIAARPEYRPTWMDRDHVTTVVLAPLELPLIRQLVETVAGDAALPAQVVEQIAAKAEGVPLFAEELTKAVLESRSPGEPRSWSDAASSVQDVPSTLHDGLMARLDRLGPAKGLAQIGAAIGRKFSMQLLGAATQLLPQRLQEGLRRLVDAEMVAHDPEQDEYIWHHALLQDAAYASLLRPRRRALHQAIAQAIETTLAHLVDSEPEALAHHWSRTDQPGLAVRYGLKAGQRALARSANVEAIRHLTSAIEWLPQVIAERERDSLAFGLYLALGQACYVVKGPAAPETAAAYTRAQELVEQFDDIEQRCTVLYGIFSSYHFAARFDLAAEPATRTLELAQKHGDAGHLCQAHRMLGYMHFFKGECREALHHFHELSRLYQPARHGPLAARYGADCRIAALAFQALIEAVCGDVDRALRTARDNLAYARSLGHPASQGWVYAATGYLHFWLRRPDDALAITTEGVRFCREHSIGSWELHCRAFNAWARCFRSDPSDCAAELQGIIAAVPSGNLLGLPLLRVLLAEALLAAGRPQDALDETDRGIEELTATGQHFFAPSLHHLRAECLLQLAALHDDEARKELALKSFDDAVISADRMGANLLGLRAALCRVPLASGGARERALDAVAQLAAHFAPAVEFPELRQARELLARRDAA